MSDLEKEIISSRVHGMTKEEKEIALKAIPTSLLLAELSRREEITKDVLENIYNTLNTVKADISLTELQEVIKTLKKKNKWEEKMGPEKTFETKVKKFITDQNCWFVKFFANKMTKEGIPDVLCCINGYFVAVEIKAAHGKASDLQIYHCKKIREANGFAFILYPSGFDQFKKFVEGLHNDTYTRDMPLFLK